MVKIFQMCFAADNNLAIHTDGLSFFRFLKLHLIFHYTHLKDQLITNSRNPEKQLLPKKKISKTKQKMQVETVSCTSCNTFHKNKKGKQKKKKCSYNKSHQVNKTYAY